MITGKVESQTNRDFERDGEGVPQPTGTYSFKLTVDIAYRDEDRELVSELIVSSGAVLRSIVESSGVPGEELCSGKLT